jgi:hypothetical protein
MIRTLEHKKTAAIDTRDWLASINTPPDEAVTLFLSVLDCTIEDYDRVQHRHAITSHTFYSMRNSQAVCGILLEDLLEQHADELRGFDITMQPETKTHLLFIVLNDCLDQLTSSLLHGRIVKGFTPISPAELSAMKRFNLL